MAVSIVKRTLFFMHKYGWLLLDSSYSEKKRLSERHLFFDIHKLLNIIATSIGQSSDDIIRFAKIAEGGSYRVFEACFKDGRDIVARLPYPCTIPHQYGVASEVATIEYLRSHGVPAPKVLDWSSTSTNPIGNEYIIMEKARGRELEETWCTMRSDRRESLMKRIVNIEKLLFKLEFPASGSLYFMDSLPNEVETVVLPDNKSFCIGPSTELLWWAL